MSAVGGPIESVAMRGRIFAVAHDADGQRKLGGDENEVMPNGDGSARIIKARAPWQLGGLALVVDDGRGDQQFLKEIADSNNFVTCAITLASGETWQGRGTITGEVIYSSTNATAEVTLMGEGELTQQ